MVNKKTKTPEQIKKRKIRNTIIGILALTICLGAIGVGGYYAYGVLKEVEDFSKDRLLTPESSVLMMEDGTEYYSYNKSGATKNVAYDDIPQVMIDAVIAAEDSRYFVHNGFDLPRIIKSVITNLSAGGIRSGGSTITQQIIKKSYYPKEEQISMEFLLNGEKSREDKIKESYKKINREIGFRVENLNVAKIK